MQYLIWSGAALSLLGLLGIIWCILLAVKARNAGLDDETLRQRLQKIVALNLAALMISAFGLILVTTGVILQ